MIIRFDICQPGFYATSFWAKVLRNEHVSAKMSDERFTDWMQTQYKCKVLQNAKGDYIGVDIEEDGLTMLLLKYPTYAVRA